MPELLCHVGHVHMPTVNQNTQVMYFQMYCGYTSILHCFGLKTDAFYAIFRGYYALFKKQQHLNTNLFFSGRIHLAFYQIS